MTRTGAALIVGFLFASALLGAQMPDLSQMSGIPLPSGDLAVGSVSVRVVRGALTNNVTNQPVELHVGPQVQNAATDQDGRALFTGLTAGATARAVTTVDGQRLESQEFPIPGAGGVRLMLVARAPGSPPAPREGLATGPAPSPAAQPGMVSLGSQSRSLVEITDEGIDVYWLLEIVNPAAAPVEPSVALIFEVSPGAGAPTLLDGSSPQAKAEGQRVTMSGPLAPGATAVQFAYRVPYEGSDLTIRQTLPVALPQTSLLVRKIASVAVNSPQITQQRESTLEGRTYYVASGPGVPAGGAVEINLTGLPHHSTVPRYLALALVVLIVGVGTWFSVGESDATPASRSALEARRERLFSTLQTLDEQHGSERPPSSSYQARRRDLITQLEEVYTRLDDLSPSASAGGSPRDAAAAEPSFRRA